MRWKVVAVLHFLRSRFKGSRRGERHTKALLPLARCFRRPKRQCIAKTKALLLGLHKERCCWYRWRYLLTLYFGGFVTLPDPRSPTPHARTQLRAWAALALLVLTVSCTSGSEPCQSPDDCNNPDRICANGECLVGTCRTDFDCPNSFVCYAGECNRSVTVRAPECEITLDCPEGTICRQGVCLDDGFCGGPDAVPCTAEPDEDGDGFSDIEDLCPGFPNATQDDTDGDGQGDECDFDDDNDEVFDPSDNCPGVSNPDQADTDGDGLGDACDPTPGIPSNDADGDGVVDSEDVCPGISDPEQTDTDGDGRGDACDPDPTQRNFKLRGRVVWSGGNSTSPTSKLRSSGRQDAPIENTAQGQRFKITSKLVTP